MNKDKQLNIRMTQSEFNDFRCMAAKTGLSQSVYIRMLLKGNRPKSVPPLEYDKLMRELYDCIVLLKQYGAKPETIDKFNNLLLTIQAEVLLPDRME